MESRCNREMVSERDRNGEKKIAMGAQGKKWKRVSWPQPEDSERERERERESDGKSKGGMEREKEQDDVLLAYFSPWHVSCGPLLQ